MHQKALLSSTKEKTMLIETNLNKSSVSVPKLLSWDEVTKNLRWVLNNAFIPQKKEKEVCHIIEHPNGKVEIKFENESPRFLVVKEIPLSSLTFPIKSSFYLPKTMYILNNYIIS